MRFAAWRRLGLRKTVFGLSPSAQFFSATFFCALELLRNSFIAHKKTSHTAKTLGASFLNWLGKVYKK
jgi:hypothetical protein